MPEPQVTTETESAGSAMSLEELLRPEQVAKLFNVSPRTVTYWAWRGKLDSVRTPGGQYRFRPSDVAARLADTQAVA